MPPAFESHARAWLTLLRAPGLGPARLRALLEQCGDVERALASPAAWQRIGMPAAAQAWCRAPDVARLQADLEWLAQPAHHLLTCDSADFPALLAGTPQ